MKIVLALIMTLAAANVTAGDPDWNEAEWSLAECVLLGGKTEHVLPDKTRVDCLTDDLAIEHDFAKKWYQCITQGLHYAMWTGRQAACSLIIEKESEMKYYKRAERLIAHYGLPVKLWRTNVEKSQPDES